MEVQFLKTFKCSGQISPNSCHFWNNRSFFLQILRQFSGSWDITPLHFLAKILYASRSLSKYKFGEILREQLEVRNFGLFLSKSCTVPAKKVQKSHLSRHWTVIQSLKKNSLFVWKMTRDIWWILTGAMKNWKICTLM